MDSDAPIHGLENIWTEYVAIWDQVTSFLSVASNAEELKESDCVVCCQKINELYF